MGSHRTATALAVLLLLIASVSADIVLQFRVRCRRVNGQLAPTRVSVPLGRKPDVGRFSVDWGDSSPLQLINGPIEECETGSVMDYCISHDFTQPATYQVRISEYVAQEPDTPHANGSLTHLGWGTPEVTWKPFQTLVDFFGVLEWDWPALTSLSRLFQGVTTTHAARSALPDHLPSGVLDLSFMFHGCSHCNHSSLLSWDTRKIRTLEMTFAMTGTFDQPIGQWDVSSVENLQGTFAGALIFNQNLTQWNTSSLIITSLAFMRTHLFNGDISSWNMSRVENTEGMFYAAASFNGNISNWDMSHVYQMRSMFRSTGSFNGNISTWNVLRASNMDEMFYEAHQFCGDLTQWKSEFLFRPPVLFASPNSCLQRERRLPDFQAMPRPRYETSGSMKPSNETVPEAAPVE